MTSMLTRRTGLVLTLLALASCDRTATEPEPAASRPPEVELAVASNSWTTLAPMRRDRYDPTVASVPHPRPNSESQTDLYVIGGRTESGGHIPLGNVELWNGSWVKRASLPVPLYQTNGAGVIDGKIYLSGGVNAQRQVTALVYMYDPASNQWTRKRDLPARGYGGVTSVYQNMLYVVTSCGEVPNCSTEPGALGVFRYDPVADQWTFLSPAHGDHAFGMGGFIGGKFYLTGGFSNQPPEALDVFDPATNSWGTGAPMPSGRRNAAYATIGGRLYIAGGTEEVQQNFFLSKSVIRYDAATNKWETLAPMPKARRGITGGRVVVTSSPQLRFEVVGGAGPGNNLLYTP